MHVQGRDTPPGGGAHVSLTVTWPAGGVGGLFSPSSTICSPPVADIHAPAPARRSPGTSHRHVPGRPCVGEVQPLMWCSPGRPGGCSDHPWLAPHPAPRLSERWCSPPRTNDRLCALPAEELYPSQPCPGAGPPHRCLSPEAARLAEVFLPQRRQPPRSPPSLASAKLPLWRRMEAAWHPFDRLNSG